MSAYPESKCADAVGSPRGKLTAGLLQRRHVRNLLVWKLDRFARSLKFLVVSLAELAAVGVAFVSLRDNLDLSTPMGRFMAQLLGAMAEFEKELIRERVQAGLDRRKNELQKRGWFTSKRGNRCSALGRKKVSVDVAQITQTTHSTDQHSNPENPPLTERNVQSFAASEVRVSR